MVICKEGEPSDEEDNPTLINAKKYDPNKVKLVGKINHIPHRAPAQ